MTLVGSKIGSIRLDSLLGRGGMGRVYRGFDELLLRPVAVKTLRSQAGLSEVARARFVREARVLSQLNHPNVCQVYGLLEANGVDFLVLELIEGRTLAELAPELSPARRLAVAAAVVEGIAAAHRMQIVHRDLKPENIMITGDGQVKVLDFGIARPVDGPAMEWPDGEAEVFDAPSPATETEGDPDPTIAAMLRADAATPSSSKRGFFATELGSAVGTIAYMSPEQARGEQVTVASDIFSLGLVLQELWTGQRAYPQLPPGALLARVQQGAPEPLVGVEPEIAHLIRAMQAPDPLARPTADATRERLRALIARPTERRAQRRRAAAAAVAGVLLLGALGALAHSKVEAQRRAELAQRFTREAAEIESTLRIAYLAPRHDIRPILGAVQKRMAALQAEIDTLRALAKGPGETALGRAALALESYESARQHFAAAWDAGYRSPEVASGLGLATFELYRRELSTVQRITSESARRRAEERLRETLREPARIYLASGRQALAEVALPANQGDHEGLGGPVESLDYVEALLALDDERFDEALERARATVAAQPLFFEGYLLMGKICRARTEKEQARGNFAGAAEAYERGRQALRQATEVGRSHPGVYLELCSLELSRLVLELYYGTGEEVEGFLAGGLEACRAVLEIDPDHVEARVGEAELLMRQAEAYGVSDASRQALARAAVVVEEALRYERTNARAWKTLGHVSMVEADWLLYQEQNDPVRGGELVRAANAAYQEAVQLAPEDAVILNALANSYNAMAASESARGLDPRQSVERAEEIYRQILARDPAEMVAYHNLNLGYSHRVRYEVGRGIDPASTVTRAIATFEAGRERAGGDKAGMSGESFAEVCLEAARWGKLHGEDPEVWIERAFEAIGSDPEQTPSRYYALRGRLVAWALRAEVLLLAGDDPSPALERARKAVAVLERSNGSDRFLQLAEGQLWRLEAARLLRDGTDASAALRQGRRFLEALVASGSFAPEARLESARLAMLEARARLGRGQDPGPAFARAEADLVAGMASRPFQFEFYLEGARLSWARAAQALTAGTAVADRLARGRELLLETQARHASLPEVTALGGAFDLLEARAEGSASRRQELLAMAVRKLEQALAANPLLRSSYGPELEAARRALTSG